MDEAIATLISVAGATPELAAQYAQLADGDANQAVQLWFENGGVDLSGGNITSQPPPQTTSNQAGGPSHPIALDDDDDSAGDANDPVITGVNTSTRPNEPPHSSAPVDFEDDEAMARRLQEEMYGEGATQEPRAPIARQAETLVGPGSDPFSMRGMGYEDAVQERLRGFQTRRTQRSNVPGIFNQHQPSSIWERDSIDNSQILAESTGGESESTTRTNRLARLFQPPWDLMFKGEWDDARDEGKEHKKWLLVDIQNNRVFDCQALNRDLWKNEGIVETVKENFVFLQYNKDDPRASQYIQYYFQGYENEDEYPHVAIVDPRTGEQIKLWSRKVPSPAEFLMQLHEFLDRYSLDNSARNPVAKRKSEIKKEKPIDQLSEEEMLERALQASLAGASQDFGDPAQAKQAPAEDPDDLTRSIGDVRKEAMGNSESMDIDSSTPPTDLQETSAFSQIPSTNPHVEPAQGPSVTRVQIRHPGGRVVRRFAETDTVQRIYEFLKAEPLEGREGADFELISMGKNLIDDRNSTIAEAGLKNGTVMVEFIE
ncbi:hypothetical protein B0A52_02748 [Exophiala mesophila]|uniref:UBX domain-containing protein n=1 Tax=Exophiala mesophila TaxID=212818 RepID=A0A438NDU1_EXOME|nr:hypothetical protein B0A52_02748 [Exophiala mesophila]